MRLGIETPVLGRERGEEVKEGDAVLEREMKERVTVELDGLRESGEATRSAKDGAGGIGS